jgi:hypothetical protein
MIGIQSCTFNTVKKVKKKMNDEWPERKKKTLHFDAGDHNSPTISVGDLHLQTIIKIETLN